VATGTSTAPVGPAVRLQEHTCQACTHLPAPRDAGPRSCVLPRLPPAAAPAPCAGGGKRNKIDTSSGRYRWAHAVTNQRLAIELARSGLRTALLGMYDGAKLEQAVKQALADLDAVIDERDSHTIGARRAA
jgi:hypothetical protein